MTVSTRAIKSFLIGILDAYFVRSYDFILSACKYHLTKEALKIYRRKWGGNAGDHAI